MNKIDGCDIIVVAKLFTLIRNYRYGMNSTIREKFNQLSEKIDEKVPNTIQEYNFFDGLHVQTPEDNVISLIKIMKRLDIDIPDIPINTQDIESSYRLVWEQIGQGMGLTPDTILDIAIFATQFLNEHEEQIANENIGYCDNLYKHYRKVLKIIEDENTIIDNKPPIYHIVNDMVEFYKNEDIPEDDLSIIYTDVYNKYKEYGNWYCRTISNQIITILNSTY